MSANLIPTRIQALRYEAKGIISIELVALDAPSLPAFSAGAHLDVHLGNGIMRSYSLLNDQNERHRYVLGVLKDPASRGGSRYIHEQFRVGNELKISAPRNHFALNEEASHSVLIAGGIGITPILSMYRRLRELGRRVELFYCARSRAETAFLTQLTELGGDIQYRFDDENDHTPPDLASYLASKPASADFYCCGPTRMLDAFEQSCETLHYPHYHLERFTAQTIVSSSPAHGYEVVLAKSQKTVQVAAEQSLLDALIAAGLKLDYSCKEGICGACETKILAGEAEHRDSVLSKAEKAQQKSMMICVSACQGKSLTLDL